MLPTAPEPSQTTANAPGDVSKPKDDAPAVRFASSIEEISPSAAVPATSQDQQDYSFSEVAADELKSFTKSLQGRPLQERRMNTFQFEAFSLPPSRVSPSLCAVVG